MSNAQDKMMQAYRTTITDLEIALRNCFWWEFRKTRRYTELIERYENKLGKLIRDSDYIRWPVEYLTIEEVVEQYGGHFTDEEAREIIDGWNKKTEESRDVSKDIEDNYYRITREEE